MTMAREYGSHPMEQPALQIRTLPYGSWALARATASAVSANASIWARSRKKYVSFTVNSSRKPRHTSGSRRIRTR